MGAQDVLLLRDFECSFFCRGALFRAFRFGAF